MSETTSQTPTSTIDRHHGGMPSHKCLKPEENPTPKADDVIEMALCEVPHICLRPDQLYRFVVMSDCEKCESAATPYRKVRGRTDQIERN